MKMSASVSLSPVLPPTKTIHDVATVLGWLRDDSVSLNNAFGSGGAWTEDMQRGYILNLSRNHPAGMFVFRISDQGRECLDGNQRLLSLRSLLLMRLKMAFAWIICRGKPTAGSPQSDLWLKLASKELLVLEYCSVDDDQCREIAEPFAYMKYIIVREWHCRDRKPDQQYGEIRCQRVRVKGGEILRVRAGWTRARGTTKVVRTGVMRLDSASFFSAGPACPASQTNSPARAVPVKTSTTDNSKSSNQDDWERGGKGRRRVDLLTNEDGSDVS
ncbi:hypothetical protein FA13DRAFT_1714964 [Coprinellus micaceus]|uniref:DUF262 domain-containing protein n=1 Tax=Coprinellus micaceus TaxID=71717 RepID=A0A4Y7SQH9_COPMI|nr:hypothetical protein FA13DRAFT_1714964 [Coprinellus micaceus]